MLFVVFVQSRESVLNRNDFMKIVNIRRAPHENFEIVIGHVGKQFPAILYHIPSKNDIYKFACKKSVRYLLA